MLSLTLPLCRGHLLTLVPESCDLEVQTVASVVVSDVYRGGRLLSGRWEPTDIHRHFYVKEILFLIFLQHFGGSVVVSIAASPLVLEVYRLPFSPFLVFDLATALPPPILERLGFVVLADFCRCRGLLHLPDETFDLFQGGWRGSTEERYERAWQSFRGSFVPSPFHLIRLM